MTALLLLGLAGFFLLALGSHSLSDPQGLLATLNAAGVHNAGGKAGALVAAYCLWGLGLAAFWVPLLLLGLAWQSHRRGLEDLGWPQAAAALGVLLASAGLLALGWPYVSWSSSLLPGGGRLGNLAGRGAAVPLQPRRRRPGPGPGPARQLHGGDSPVLCGADFLVGPGDRRLLAALVAPG